MSASTCETACRCQVAPLLSMRDYRLVSMGVRYEGPGQARPGRQQPVHGQAGPLTVGAGRGGRSRGPGVSGVTHKGRSLRGLASTASTASTADAARRKLPTAQYNGTAGSAQHCSVPTAQLSARQQLTKNGRPRALQRED